MRLAERLFQQGQQAADPLRGAPLLQAALALWRGRPLTDLAGLPWLEEQAERLDLFYVEVKQAWFGAKLASGEHVTLVPELEQMVADRPLDEHIRAQLMLALYRSGRQADALATFHRLRRTLVAELGIEPSRELHDLETAMLRQDPALDPPAPVGLASRPYRSCRFLPSSRRRCPPSPGVARNWPASTRSSPERPKACSNPGAAAVIVVSGTAGVGKTALAVHWGRRAAASFPEGQLYVDLRGFDPTGTPAGPAVVVRGFLDALGVSAARIPEGLDAQFALYRSLLVGRRMLVVLDNARDAEQVRALLPGASAAWSGHQPQPPGQPGRVGGRPAGHAGAVPSGRGPRTARPPPGPERVPRSPRRSTNWPIYAHGCRWR